jgi:hypothetical protein
MQLHLIHVLAVAGLLTACTSEDPVPAKTVQTFCAAKAAAECQVAARCGTDVTACSTQRQTLCETAAADAASFGRVFSATQSEACVAKVKALYVKVTPITPTELAAVADACERVMAGTVKALEACPAGTYQCSGKLICDKGFCGTPTAKASGQPCANPGDICGAAFHCAANASGLPICQANVVKGQPCSATAQANGPGPCLSTLRCDTTSTCTDRIASGGDCTPGADECVATAPYCHPTLKKCTAGITYSAMETEACKPFSGS